MPTKFELHLYIAGVALNALALGYRISADTTSWPSQIVVLSVVLSILNVTGLVYGWTLVYSHMKAVRYE